MSLKEGKGEILMGFVFVLLGLLFLVLIIPGQIKYVEGAYPQPRFFPNLICSLMTVLGAVLLIGGIKKIGSQEEVCRFRWQELRLLLITIALMALYVFSMEFIPYFPATVIITGVLVALYGQKKLWKILLTALLVPALIYVGLRYGLKVHLP